MLRYGLILKRPKGDDDEAIELQIDQIMVGSGMDLIEEGGLMLIVDGGASGIHDAIHRAEAAGGCVRGVRALGCTDTDGIAQTTARSFDLMLRARNAVRRTPQWRMLWTRYAP